MRTSVRGLTIFALAILPAAACVPTGFNGLTAAVMNPSATITGDINAAGCDIGVFFNVGKGSVNKASIHGALYFGVAVVGDSSNVAVDVLNSNIHDIGDSPLNGMQRGVGIYFRAYYPGGGSVTGKISGNTVWNYQKGGIVVNGPGSNADVSGNTVQGQGPVPYIAQNGIQIGYGASAQVMRNVVTGNSYTGTSTVSGGIILVGGPGYGACPGVAACFYTTGVQIVGNTATGNDIGIWLSNIDAMGNSPTTATNNKVVNNTITNQQLNNDYGGFGYQAGIADQGDNDKLINNTIAGAGYTPSAYPNAYVVAIDADPSFTNRPKVHANKID